MGLIFDDESTYKVASDGYVFDYYDEDDNKRMLKLYKKTILPIVKDFKLKRCFKDNLEFNIFDSHDDGKPIYIYTPKSKEELTNFITRVRDATYYGTSCMEEMEVDKKYIIYFSDDDGEFSISHILLDLLKEDIQKLTDMVKDL